MATSSNNHFQQLLQQLFNAVQNNDPTALPRILSLIEKTPNQPNLLHLAGLAYQRLGDPEQAVRYLQRSLRHNPQQAEVNNSLANIHKARKSFPDAEKHYKAAIELRPQYQEAWKNLGLLYSSELLFAQAESTLQRALELQPDNVSVLTALGNLHKELEQYEQAISHYRQALALDPGYANALHNLGLCYKLTEQLDQAVACYEKARTAAPTFAEIDYNYANALFELGDHQQAEVLYQSAISKNPRLTLAHETLSELYWQSGQADKMEISYREAIDLVPDDTGLRLSFANLLIATGQFNSAREIVEAALEIDRTPQLLHARGKLYANQLDYNNARFSFEQALAGDFSNDIAQDLARLHIVEGSYQTALKLLEQMQQHIPHDQLNWALKGLCWRLLDDRRYEWLIDYERHIRAYPLPTPSGYANQEAFLDELETVLVSMHNTQLEPSQQTLKQGTQTPGRLLHKPNPVIQAYKWSLTQVVQEYINKLPDDPTHPLSGRKESTFVFSGSWSVKLGDSGFHVNHVHPEGWISSACYIRVPGDLVHNAGAIKFGESALGLGDREVTERIISPQRGQLVLFPSYVWHGTYEFSCGPGAYRLTAPFDVIPGPAL